MKILGINEDIVILEENEKIEWKKLACCNFAISKNSYGYTVIKDRIGKPRKILIGELVVELLKR